MTDDVSPDHGTGMAPLDEAGQEWSWCYVDEMAFVIEAR